MGRLSAIDVPVRLLIEQPHILLGLYRKFSKKIESRRGVYLSPDEVDVFVAVGAYETVAAAAIAYQVETCRERNAQSHSISEAPSASIDAMAGRTSKSSGTTSIDAANEALAQARAICGRRS